LESRVDGAEARVKQETEEVGSLGEEEETQAEKVEIGAESGCDEEDRKAPYQTKQ